MHYWKGVAALTHGLGWLQKNPAGVRNLALLHTQHVRHLQDWSKLSASSTTSSSTSMFGSTDENFGKAMSLVKDKCNLDVQELAMKVGMQMMTGGAFDMKADPKEMSPADQVSMINLINQAVAPAGEKKCTQAQDKQFLIASEAFSTCLGFKPNEAVEFDVDHLLQVNELCQASSSKAISDNCTDAVFSDKIIVGALRDLYQHPGKYCSCLQVLKEDIPACTVTLGTLIDESGEKPPKDFDDSFRQVELSLGFFKTEICVIGLGCDALEGACFEELDGLEQCLPEVSTSCEKANSSVCENNLFYAVPPEVSQGFLPDVCLKAYRDHKLKSTAVNDFANYVKKCFPEVLAVGTGIDSISVTTEGKDSTSSFSSFMFVAVVVSAILGIALFALVFVVLKKETKVEYNPLTTDEDRENQVEDMS